MDERRPFRPADPISVGDQEARLAAAAKQVRRRRATRAGAVGAAVVAAAAAVAIPLALTGSSHRNTGLTIVTPSVTTVPTTVATVPPTTVPSPVTTIPVPVTSTTVPPTTTTLPSQLTGTITGPDGAPVPGALLIDASTLAVYHADANGKFAIPCGAVDNIYVANWIIPLGTSYFVQGAKPGSAGGSTTFFTPPPTTDGPGYARLDKIWSQASANPVPCQGPAIDAQMPAGGTVDITWLKQTGTSAPAPVSGPVDGYYEIMPGLPYSAGTYMPQGDASGHQVMAQLGAGGLALDSNSRPFTCTGGGVIKTSGSSWEVPVVAGQTDDVTCTVPG